jgi:hypothetical protein
MGLFLNVLSCAEVHGQLAALVHMAKHARAWGINVLKRISLQNVRCFAAIRPKQCKFDCVCSTLGARTGLMGPSMQTATRRCASERVIGGSISLFALGSKRFHHDLAPIVFPLFSMSLLVSLPNLHTTIQSIIFHSCSWHRSVCLHGRSVR